MKIEKSSNQTPNFGYLDKAPIAIIIVKVKNKKTIEFGDFSIVYGNEALEKFIGYNFNQLASDERHQLVWEKHKDYPNILHDIAYGGIRNERVEYREDVNKYIKISYYQPVEGYTAFIISNITNNNSISIDTILHYQKIEVILKNSIDYIFEINLETMEICKDAYIKGKNDLIKDGIIIPSDWLNNKQTTKESANKVNQAINNLKAGNIEVEVNLELRETKNQPFKWFKLVFNTYINQITNKKSVVVYAKNTHKDVIKLNQLAEKAKKDQMTNIYNVEHAKKTIETFLHRNPNNKSAFFIIDIDDFKCINDTFGHPCGDKVIKLIASILKESFRSTDIVFRIGGDEFGVFAPSLSKLSYIKTICGTIAAKIKDGVPELDVTVSIGVSINNMDNPTFDNYYHAADKILYTVKGAGKQGFAITHF